MSTIIWAMIHVVKNMCTSLNVAQVQNIPWVTVTWWHIRIHTFLLEISNIILNLCCEILWRLSFCFTFANKHWQCPVLVCFREEGERERDRDGEIAKEGRREEGREIQTGKAWMAVFSETTAEKAQCLKDNVFLSLRIHFSFLISSSSSEGCGGFIDFREIWGMSRFFKQIGLHDVIDVVDVLGQD